MDVNLDPNNNSTDSKGYSLRPRSTAKSTENEEYQEEVQRPRGRTQRSSKQKSLPLSKYRRKTANARERSRMREINEAFENLRKSIPLVSTKCDNPSEKNTKISTLRLAMKYITVLSNALRESDGESDKESSFSEYCLTSPDYRDTCTPTSTSDNSDLSDTFFSTNFSPTHCLSPFSTSSSFNFINHPADMRHLLVSTPQKKSCSRPKHSVLRYVNDDSNMNSLQNSSPNSGSAYTLLPRSTIDRVPAIEGPGALLTPTEDGLRLPGFLPITLQLQSAPIIDDWDDLNLSKVDLEEYLIS